MTTFWRIARNRRVKALLRRLIWLARRLAPARDHVVVFGWPQSEGNSVEVVRHLGSEGVDVRWLLDEPPDREIAEVLSTWSSVTARKRLSAHGLIDYLTARVTFYTHGLFLSAASPRRKTIVNLWHGDGPKRNFMPNGEPPPFCHFVVSCCLVFGRAKATFFGVPPENLLVTGNPRNDRLFREPTAEALDSLGLRPGRFVVFMPTYRSSKGVGSTVAWKDSEHEEDPRVAALSHMVEAAAGVELEIVVKPHPLDAATLAVPGARVVLDTDLAAAGLNSYQLLAASHSLVTDYSSIWTDYLSTGKHVAFAVPDWEAYAATRGLDDSVERAALPGPVVFAVDDFAQFFHAIETGGADLAAQRDRSVETLGLVTAQGNSRRLMAALAERGVPLVAGSS